MKRLLCLPLVFAPLACQHPGSECGWSFQVGRPAVVHTSALAQPSMTNYGTSAIGGGPVMGPAGTSFPIGPPLLAPVAPPAFGAGPCVPTSYATPAPSMSDVLEELRQLRRSVSPPPPARTLPMPRSTDCSVTHLVLCAEDWQPEEEGR